MAELKIEEMGANMLFAGTEMTPVTTSVLIKPNVDLKAGSILGKVSGQEYYDIVSGDTNADYILANDTTTGDAPEETVVYQTGVFSSGALSVGKGDSLEAHREELRDRTIYFKDEM